MSPEAFFVVGIACFVVAMSLLFCLLLTGRDSEGDDDGESR